MAGLFVLLGGIVLWATVFVIIDTIGYRRDQRGRRR